MQLEQILSAAVAAGNVDELDVDNLPSPDVPQTSPGPPMPCSTRRSSITELSSSSNIVSGDINIIGSVDNEDGSSNVIKTRKNNNHDSPEEGRNVCVDLVAADPLNAVSDEISFFNLGEDSLVITSQQALAMFETHNEENNSALTLKQKSQSSNTRKSINQIIVNKSISDDNKLKQFQPVSSFQTLESVDIVDQCGDEVPSACGEVEIQTSDAVTDKNSSVSAEDTNIVTNVDILKSPDIPKNSSNFPSTVSIECSNSDLRTRISTTETVGVDIKQTINESMSKNCNSELDLNKTFIADLNEDKPLNNTHTTLPLMKELSIENVTSTLEETTNKSVETISLTNSSQPEYTPLIPVSSTSTTPRLDDAISALTGLDSSAGATLDATLDENGQFLVQVIAPGLNMSIPNQFLNKSHTGNVSGSDKSIENKSKLHLLDNISEQLADIEKSVCVNVMEPTVEEVGNKRKRESSLSIEGQKLTKPKSKNVVKSQKTKHLKKNSFNGCHQSKLERKIEKMKKKKLRRAEMSCISPATNVQFFNQINQSQHPRQNQNYNYPDLYFNGCPSSNYSQYDHTFTNGVDPNVPCQYQNKPHYPANTQVSTLDQTTTWNIDEMLNPKGCNTGGSMDFLSDNNKMTGDFTNYGNHNNSNKSMVSDHIENEEDSEEMPIIMSPEEYHGKVQGGGRYQNSHGISDVIQTTNTDGESLKVQLVYLVYPCKKKNGKRADAGDRDTWNNDRKREAMGYRTDHYPPPGQHYSSAPYGQFPYAKPDTPYHPQIPCGYTGAPQYHSHHREDPTRLHNMYRHGPPPQMYHPLHHGMHHHPVISNFHHPHQILPPQHQPSAQQQHLPADQMIHEASISGQDKDLNWLSKTEGLSPSLPRAPVVPSVILPDDSQCNRRKIHAYKSLPMAEWQYRDVTHFLLEATCDLGIKYENADLTRLSNVNGKKLLFMEPKEFETFSPGDGQRVYEYVQRHKNHEMLTREPSPNKRSFFQHDSKDQQISTPPPLDMKIPSLMYSSEGSAADQSALSATDLMDYNLEYDAPPRNKAVPKDNNQDQSSNYHTRIETPNNGSLMDHNIPIDNHTHPPNSLSLEYSIQCIPESHESSGLKATTLGSSSVQDQIGMYHAPSPVMSTTQSSVSYNHQGDVYSVPDPTQAQYLNINYDTASNNNLQPPNTPQVADKILYYPPYDSTSTFTLSNNEHEVRNLKHIMPNGPYDAGMIADPYYDARELDDDSSGSDDDDDLDDDDEDIEEEAVAVAMEQEAAVVVKPLELPKKRGPGRPPKPESERKKKKKKTGRLWEFIRNLLLNEETCPSIVRWEDSETGLFRFVQSEKVAERWGMRKNNKKMNYEKLSRAMRYYYKGKVFEPVLGRRLVYKFGCNAKGWKPNNGNFDK